LFLRDRYEERVVPKKFSSGLDVVLEHRKSLEDAALAALAVCRQGYVAVVGELDRIRVEMQRRAGEMPILGAPIQVRNLKSREEHLRFLNRAQEVQALVVAQRVADVQSARQAVFVARRARKVIEALRERKEAAFRQAEMRAERVELDETNMRHGRLRSKGSG
jgi:flagellar export protein FliJ